MYCDKLTSIVQQFNEDVIAVDEIVIKKLDIFIKERTTVRERRKLNPYKFSIEMNISQEISLRAFILGAKCRLFNPIFYYMCECGDQFEVININVKRQCTCRKEIIPDTDKSRLYLYFKLLEDPIPCPWEEDKDIYPLDLLKGEGYGTENFTLADVDRLVGTRYTTDLISISIKDAREEYYKQFIEGEDGFATP